MTPLTLLSRLGRMFRRPLRIELTASHDQAANALHGLAHFLNRRPDMTGRRIRIDLTIRPAKRTGGQR